MWLSGKRYIKKQSNSLLYGLFVKRSRRCPFKAESGVRLSYRLPFPTERNFMKVYLLKQENYGDTTNYGIFTDKGKATLEQRFIELGKQEADKEFQKLNTLINQYSDEARRLNEIQLPLLRKQQEAKANGDYELMKQIRKERHKPLKEL